MRCLRLSKQVDEGRNASSACQSLTRLRTSLSWFIALLLFLLFSYSLSSFLSDFLAFFYVFLSFLSFSSSFPLSFLIILSFPPVLI